MDRNWESADFAITVEHGNPTIITRRVVTAPRSLVFDAFTKPEYLVRWMAPRALACGYRTTVVLCESHVRVGSVYRFVLRAPEGQEFGFHGTYREIVRPERIIRTFVFETMPEHESVERMLLEEHDGKTTITTTTVHKTAEGCDGYLVEARMVTGMINGRERLDDLLASLQGGAPPLAAR